MTTNHDTDISDSQQCESSAPQSIQEFPIRRAEIGQGTVIKRALPDRHKRMIGAWCFWIMQGRYIFHKAMAWMWGHTRILACKPLPG